MTVSRWHMSVTLLLTLLLHAGLILWLSTPQPRAVENLPAEAERPLRVSVLARVADNTTRAMNADNTGRAESVVSSESPPVAAAKPATAPPLPELVRALQPVSSKPPLLPKPKPVAPPAPVAEPVPVPEPPTLTPQRTITDAVIPAASASAINTPAETAPMLSAAATASYEQLLVAWLEQYKKYPRRAKRLRIEGEGMLRIHIDRSGQTLQVSLEARTGNRFLDKAALAMAQRANPFPPMPEKDPRETLEFRVPVVFALN